MSPPPGWYPDPSAPHQERWWDGSAWTEHRRVPGAAGYAAPQAPPPSPLPPYAGGPGQRRPAGGTGRAKAVALTTAAAVLVAAIVGGVLLLGEDDGGAPEAQTPPVSSPATDPAPVSTAPTSSPPPSGPSADDPALVEDPLNGITFPLPDGWVRPRYVAEDDVMMTTDGTYDCPGDGGVCRHGLVISRTVTGKAESSPKALAEQDIEDAADDAYDRDPAGGKPFGGIESHERVGAGPVAVAGRAGYYVRWRVTTAKGPGGYVQSLVFPSTVGTESPILVRYVFDAGEEGPPLATMDEITDGIRPVGDADTGGGVGSGIGPTD
ncbi:DUF2510 domain-containing protein [Streptomyces mutabilis]|uniref:DUF2510 domain-containing protein n=1 Tax=Streptomyces mutabilis TaxID=67332 RepID=UPI000A235233|nr:DUF2510 domain-containing protein [Streptomyces sp. Alain-F2R5]MDG9693713.1 DUF2510 domain-containing protein [Streptomyces sp. DH17]OSC54678.1 hypothetical protein B5181_36895 [Streptomyces sp. 4F]PAM99758.1 hypothetical protein CJI59_21295 [Streptomyces sp. Alain-F2R5]